MFLKFLAVLGVCCCVGAFSSCGEQWVLLSVPCVDFSLQCLLLLESAGPGALTQ